MRKKHLSYLRIGIFSDDKELAQPLIFHQWMDKIETLIYSKDIPENMMNLFTAKGQTTDELLRQAASGEDPIWIDRAGGLEDLLQTSLSRTIIKLEKDFGENLDDWQWGD